MNHTLLACAALMFTLSSSAMSQTKPAVPSIKEKFGALAVDPGRGFYYGFAYDHDSIEAAKEAAWQGAKKLGAKNPHVVLEWSGELCASYRAAAPNAYGYGFAFGWGIAKTKAEADSIALREARKRSKGEPTPNYAWACNSKSGPGEVLFDSQPVMLESVKIQGKKWSVVALTTTKFRNKDPVYRAKNIKDFLAQGNAGKPAYYCHDENFCQEYGYLYNGHAVLDPRGLAPYTWRIPTKADWEQLVSAYGGALSAGRHLRSPKNTPNGVSTPTNSSGLSTELTDYHFHGSEKWLFEGLNSKTRSGSYTFWTSTPVGKDLAQFYHAADFTGYEEITIGSQSRVHGFPVRVIEE